MLARLLKPIIFCYVATLMAIFLMPNPLPVILLISLFFSAYILLNFNQPLSSDIGLPNLKVPIENTAATEPQEYLREIAHYDDTTGLPNRMFFNEILNKTINHSKRHKKTLAILLLHIENFVQLAQGTTKSEIESILLEISTRLTRVLRTEDILAKQESEDYFILLNDIRKSKFASTVAEKLIKVFADPIALGNKKIYVGISIGICIFPNDGQSIEELFKNLQEAAFQARAKGSNQYQFYTAAMDIEAREYIHLESNLKKALQNKELTLYYQPKYHLQQGTIVGLEALMRWEHPELGLMSPAKFIPVAEETGLMMQLGEWALNEACQMNKHWQEKGYAHLIMALNLSAIQFNHPDIADIISKILQNSGLNPKYLELEINEKTVMENVDVTDKILNKLKSTGIQIAIDHFGTGYTSISYLKQFPISVVKIDQIFIKGIPHTPNDTAITSAFIALAHNLGMQVVAEGVETAEQVQFLSTEYCDMVQGYFMCHPLPATKIVLQFKKLKNEVLF